ncbi:GIY-YIG nuclease family protein [Flavobacterium sp.]|uniref:GIY-YIG nuclease family protein n=1 Tax=Flavobacterium sp. TaxID=239 RepID=UPI0035AF331C
MFYTYIIFSKSLQVYYKGYSADLTQRLEKHNSGNSTYTSKVNDWEMVYWKSFLTKKEALIEEKRLKKLNVNSLQKLISEFKKDEKV